MAESTIDNLNKTFKIRDAIKRGLESIKSENVEGSWYEEYIEWSQNPANQVRCLLTINDSLMESGSFGNLFYPDKNNALNIADIEINRMSLFVFERFRKHERSTVESIYFRKKSRKENKKNKNIFP